MEQQFQPQEEPVTEVVQSVAPLDTTTTEPSAQQAEEVERLLATLEVEGRKRKRRRQWIIGGVVAYILFMVFIAIISHSTAHLGSIGSIGGIMAAAAAATKGQKEATKRLAEFEDIHAVGPLAEALEFQDKDMRRIAEERLPLLLPRLQATDAHLLNTEQRNCLQRALRGKNFALSRIILKAYEQVGDERELPSVEWLAAEEGGGRKYPQLREAANSCLPFLRERAERQRASRELLRASSGFNTPSDTLLRPASATTVEVDPQELLRASSQEN